MTTRTRNLALIAIIPVLIAVLGWWLLKGSAPSSHPPRDDQVLLPSEIPSASEVPSPRVPLQASPSSSVGTEAVPIGGFERREYAVGLHELSGLPDDVAPETRIELWVAWDPPVIKKPGVQPLIRDVLIADVIPPVVPEGPTAVVLSVPVGRMSDLIFGHRYGSLSAVLAPR